MKQTRVSVLLGAGALILATQAAAQYPTSGGGSPPPKRSDTAKMKGSGIRVTKDVPATSMTPSTETMSVVGEITLATPFNMSAYANLNEKNITYLMATGDSLEIQIGHLAHSKGTDARVRDFGMMLANDHTAHLAKTWEIIKDEDVGIEPIFNDNEGARLRELLAWLQTNPASRTWDAALLRFQAQHHQNVIDILNLNMKNAHDDDLEAHIKASLTSLAKHRDSAKSIGTTLGVTIP